MTPAKREELYNQLLDCMIIQGMSYRQTSKILGVSHNTIYYHLIENPKYRGSGGFKEWLKKYDPAKYDRDYIIAKFLVRSEDRRTSAYATYASAKGDAVKLRALEVMRDEDWNQLKLLQDVGVVESKAENNVNVPVTFSWGAPPEKTE